MRIGTIALVLCFCTTAFADKEKAKEHFRKGMAHYTLDRYPEAIEEFAAGFTEEPDPVFLYNMAQAYRMGQQPANALAYYRKYLNMSPNAANRESVEKLIAALESSGGPPTVAAPPPRDLRGQPASHVADPAPSGGEGRHVDLTPPNHPPADTTGHAPADATQPPPPQEEHKRSWPVWVAVAGGVVVVGAAVAIAVVATRSPSEMQLPVGDVR